jgi:long-chain acyl-CoA synthetase
MISEASVEDRVLDRLREFSVPSRARLADEDSLATVVYEKAVSCPDSAVFSRQVDGAWLDVGYAEFVGLVRGVAKGLMARGVEVGQRILVLGATSYEWSVVDFALLSVGAITVPVYPSSSVEQIRHIVADSGSTACFVDTPEQLELVTGLIGEAAGGWLLGSGLDELVREGREVTDAAVEARRLAVRAGDVATIVYTSGTTGVPKGCVLTHRNIYAAAANVVDLLDMVFHGSPEEPAATLLFLPLAHVYGRVTQFGCVQAGVRTGPVATAADLLTALPTFQPTFLVGVPYLLEKIRKTTRPATTGSDVGGNRYADAESTAIEYGRAVRHGTAITDISPELRAAHQDFDQDIYPRLRGLLGGRLKNVIAGGASLEPSTADFFTGLGVHIITAYGLTEASSTVSMSSPHAYHPDAVGQPVPGTVIAIAEDSEILVRGDQVFPGYWPHAASQQPAGEAEWLATGDLGHLDQDGYLHITGRRKDIIITSGGKNVAPAPLEDSVRLHPLISNCILIGENRPYITALITLDPPALRRWADDHHLDLSAPNWTDQPQLLDEIQPAVDTANKLVSKAESIRQFRILPRDFTIHEGHLTASQRLRRHTIEHDYQAVIDTLYERRPQ